MFYARPRIPDHSARFKAHDANARAQEAKRAVEGVEHNVERLLMITEALWTFMKEQHGYSDEILIEKVMDIDLEDGRLDGRVSKSEPYKCPTCTRALARHHMMCIYCGTPSARDPFER